MENAQTHSHAHGHTVPAGFSGYQKFVIGLLAFLQFTIILDFMIMSPMGAILMPVLNITTSQFGMVVSIYAFSAGVSGFISAGFADRFDRKKFLLFFYVGFLVGTLLCGLVNTFQLLLVARMVTGVFGGVIGSISMAIVADIFTFEQRGRVMGFLQTGFAASQVLGLPAGLYFANKWGWHSAFLMIVFFGILVGGLIVSQLKPLKGHFVHHKPDTNPFHHLLVTLRNPKYIFAFATSTLLAMGGFMMMPFGSAFTVNNLKIGLDKLPTIYLVVGLVSLLIGPMVGKIADTFGKFRTFVFGSLLMMVMVTIYTHLGPISVLTLIIVNSLMFVGIFSRMIPSSAMMSAIPTPDQRGSFMSVMSSLQQISGGFGAVVAGLVVISAPDGHLVHFDYLGYIMIATGLFSLMMMYAINRSIIKSK